MILIVTSESAAHMPICAVAARKSRSAATSLGDSCSSNTVPRQSERHAGVSPCPISQAACRWNKAAKS
eukprot:9502679-Pyramimonas_sp.AAC.1